MRRDQHLDPKRRLSEYLRQEHKKIEDLERERRRSEYSPQEPGRSDAFEREQRRRENFEREYERIRRTIDHMLTAQYNELNTFTFTFVLICICVLLVTFTTLFDNRLPVALREQDEPAEYCYGNSFIGQRAFQTLQEISKIGPRAVGSYENEYLTVNFLIHEIEAISSQMPKFWNKIELDVQVVDGSFSVVNSERTFRRQTVYQSIQNVVAKLRTYNNSTESILINCHFDSVFTSPGTSDDGLNCAVMLEVLRVLSKLNYSLKKNVVFLFNGAEEDGVAGSHGFITKHKWAKEIITFINLDSCGAGGRQILFQTGPKAYVLPQIYAYSATHPSGIVIAEELSQLGVLPSDTDYRIFRDHGNLKGLDFAHAKNGYVYHTENDNMAMVSENVVQLTGDNVLSLTKALVDYDHLQEAIYESNDQAVYFDVFGQFVICYSSAVGCLVNMTVVFMSLYSALSMLYEIFRGKRVKLILHHVLFDLAFLVGGILAVTVVLHLLAGLLKQSGCTMIWYSKQWFVLTYYAVPVLLVMFAAVRMRQTFFYTLLNGEQEAKVFIFNVQIIITIIFSLGTASGIRSSFILAIGLIGVSISHYFMNKTRLRLEIVEHKFLTYTVINFIPALYCAYVFIPFFEVMIPMMGRNGAEYDSETTIWLSTLIAVLITFAYFIPLVVLVKDFWTMEYLFFVLYMLQLFYILSGSVAPFNESAPQRFVALHVNRKLTHFDREMKNETSGYLLLPSDNLGGKNILMLFEIEGFRELSTIEDYCEKELFCGMPTFYPKNINSGHLSFWAPKEKPIISHRKQIKFRSWNQDVHFIVYQITLIGSKFMDIVILPLNNATLYRWSFDPHIPGNELKWKGQPAYFIRYHEGSPNKNPRQLSFELMFDVSKKEIREKHLFELAWSVFYPSNTTDQFTPKFRNFTDEFPEWTKVIPMVVEYEEYKFYEWNLDKRIS